MIVELFGIEDEAALREALAVRIRVFVHEQHVPPDEEIDEHDLTDREALHALARPAAGQPAVGAGRLYLREAGTAQIGRLAVLSEARGRGYGWALLGALMREASRRGCERVRLDAQVGARAFYLRAGFTDDGETLWDGGILHQPMSRRLP